MMNVTGQTLTDQIFQRLFDALLRAEFRPGTRLREGALAHELGVAQGTLRQALQQLEQQGLVTKSKRRGTFVTTLTADDVANIYQVRIELEPLAASLAHKRIQPQDLCQLEGLLQQMRDASGNRDFLERSKSDLEFHRSIWALSQNPWLERALNAVCPPLFASYMLRAFTGAAYDIEKDDEEHAALLAVLRGESNEEVYRVFHSMMEIFSAQDRNYIRPFGRATPPTALKNL